MAEWICSHCGIDRADNVAGTPCEQCGKVGRTANKPITVETTPLPSIEGKMRSTRYTGKKKLRIQWFDGWQLRKSVGDMVQKLRRLDRDADWYDEVVKEADGTIIHENHEKLSDHQGHGSAKFQAPTASLSEETSQTDDGVRPLFGPLKLTRIYWKRWL